MRDRRSQDLFQSRVSFTNPRKKTLPKKETTRFSMSSGVVRLLPEAGFVAGLKIVYQGPLGGIASIPE